MITTNGFTGNRHIWHICCVFLDWIKPELREQYCVASLLRFKQI